MVRYQFSYASSWKGFLSPEVEGVGFLVGDELAYGNYSAGSNIELEGGEEERGSDLREVFPEVARDYQPGEVVRYYQLSVPSLGIEGAKVKVGGEDLAESLIHYGGTAMPGEVGNSVVFGHSVLPQFFRPDDYMAIFSTLHTLKKGMEMVVDFDGIEYRYQVVEIYVVEPDDFGVLNQSEEGSYLTVITCTPPGTYLKRLVVEAKLMPWD
jgi:sortase A